MYKVVKGFPLISAAIALGFAMTLAIKSTDTGASESSGSTAGHVDSKRGTSKIELDPSQEAHCKRTSADDIHSGQCASAKRILTFMNAEPRDRVWAETMETDLRGWVESLASDGFALRNVECRLSWCIVEVGFTQGHYLFMSLDDRDKRKLFEVQVLFAPDVDDPNVEDQLIFYKRYCNSAAELLDGSGHLVPNFYTVGQKC